MIFTSIWYVRGNQRTTVPYLLLWVICYFSNVRVCIIYLYVQVKLSAISLEVMPQILNRGQICKTWVAFSVILQLSCLIILLKYCNTVEEIIPIQHETVAVWMLALEKILGEFTDCLPFLTDEIYFDWSDWESSLALSKAWIYLCLNALFPKRQAHKAQTTQWTP